MAAVILHIFRKKCQHGDEIRMFKVIDCDKSFNKLEFAMRCHQEGKMEISLSSKADGPWTKLDDDDDLYDLPISLFVSKFPDTKFLMLECSPPDTSNDKEELLTATPIHGKNAFDIMMRSQLPTAVAPDKKMSSSGMKEGLSRKDEMFNNLVDMQCSRKLTYHSKEEGRYITQSLTNALWYITNQHSVINDRSRRESDVMSVPAAFDSFEGYNELRRKKLKAQPLEADQLNSLAQMLFQLCLRPIMRSSPEWEAFYNDVKELAECFMSYKQYLLKQKEKVMKNQKMDHPARPLADNTSIQTVSKCVGDVRPPYKLLDKAMCLADYNEPMFFDELKHVEKPFEYSVDRFRYFESMQLSVTVDLVKYCPGGGITNTWCLFKVPDPRTDAEKTLMTVSNMLKIKDKLPQYHTRSMKQEFIRKVHNAAYVKPALLETIYKELGLDSSAASHPVTQQRMHMIMMGETGLLSDLRSLNPGRPSGTYDVFFTKLGELVEKFTAADDRRHSLCHFSQILSVRDLIEQTTETCPEGTPIPSAALVRLQFAPRNPYAKTALSFTSRLQVQHKVQRRQLRITHPDAHFTCALFKYLRCLAVSLGALCYLYFCDDKAKVPVGEPGVALSTGVRGKASLAPTSSTLVATDHDLHKKGSLTPSVYFRCEIPETINQSFYRGQVTTIVNDSVFQSSNPMRHAAAMVKLIRGDHTNTESAPKTILMFTDGGTDHRNTLEHVKCAAICLFKELDLDMYIAARCAPGQSWINPAERIMSILNIGLQNCSLSREKSIDNIETIIRKCTGMEDLRKANVDHPELREHWETAIEPVKEVVESRFRRLSLKGEPIQVKAPVGDEEIDLLKRHLVYMFPNMNTDRLVKSETHKDQNYIDWVEKHCRQRLYCLQIRKCDDRECCTQPTRELTWLSDPVLQEGSEHFMEFDEVYGTETSDKDRPTYQEPKKNNSSSTDTLLRQQSRIIKGSVKIVDEPALTGDASIYTAQNARFTAECTECGKPRVLYGKVKLTERYKYQLALLLSEFGYTCGAPLTPPDNVLHGKLFSRMNIDCSSPMETSYYSAIHYHSGITQIDRCFYCGVAGADTDMELKMKFKTVYPLCNDCRVKGFTVCCMRPFGKQ